MGKIEENGSNMRKMAGIAALSAAAGAVAAAMFTPKSGRDMRNSLKGKAKELGDKVKHKSDDLAE